MGNILKKHVERTCEEFVAEVAGRRRKPYLDALKSTFKAIVLGKSTLVKEMSSFLRENEGKLERKRVQELMSGWLNAYDFAALLNPYLLARSAADVTDEATLAVDFSDISKEFGGDGMEGMEMGYDGSRHCTAMGHDFISVSLVGAAYREAFPVYAKLGRGRRCHADLLYEAIRAVMEGTGGLGWLVFDRGMDDAKFLRTMKRDGRKAVVRVKDEGRDVFGDGRTVGEALADVPFAKAHLKTYRGDRLAEVRCRVRHTGNYAMRFNDGCTSNTVVNCTLEDLGAGGVWMGASRGYVKDGEKLTRRVIRNLAPRSTAFNVIDNCTIRRGGRFNPEGTGIAFTHVSDSKVVHCEIHDIYYTGVSVGWRWGFGGSVAQRNEIAFNRIHDLGKGVMSDMGGVYTLGTSFGTTVHDNVIHDVNSFSYGGWGLYCDEGSEGIVMERNLVWNTTDGGFHQHYGVDNVIRNNIFAWNKMNGAIRTCHFLVRDIPCSLHFVNNIVIVGSSPLVGRGPCSVAGIWANNLWWNAVTSPELDGLDWARWTACGKETGGRYADPQFVNAFAYDFRLKPTSPAFALGFKPWDFTQSGLRK